MKKTICPHCYREVYDSPSYCHFCGADLYERSAKNLSQKELDLLDLVKFGSDSLRNGETEDIQAQGLTSLSKAIDEGSSFAAVSLGVFCMVVEDPEQSMRFFKEAYHMGNPDGAASLASLYIDGDGGVPESYPDAVYWLEKAAALNHVFSIGLLGDLYLNGADGVRVDEAQAVKYYKKGVELDDFHCALSLGLVYRNQNEYEESVKALKKAVIFARNDDEEGRSNNELGISYCRLGQEYDDISYIERATVCFGTAAGLNNEMGKKNLEITNKILADSRQGQSQSQSRNGAALAGLFAMSSHASNSNTSTYEDPYKANDRIVDPDDPFKVRTGSASTNTSPSSSGKIKRKLTPEARSTRNFTIVFTSFKLLSWIAGVILLSIGFSGEKNIWMIVIGFLLCALFALPEAIFAARRDGFSMFATSFIFSSWTMSDYYNSRLLGFMMFLLKMLGAILMSVIATPIGCIVSIVKLIQYLRSESYLTDSSGSTVSRSDNRRDNSRSDDTPVDNSKGKGLRGLIGFLAVMITVITNIGVMNVLIDLFANSIFDVKSIVLYSLTMFFSLLTTIMVFAVSVKRSKSIAALIISVLFTGAYIGLALYNFIPYTKIIFSVIIDAIYIYIHFIIYLKRAFSIGILVSAGVAALLLLANVLTFISVRKRSN